MSRRAVAGQTEARIMAQEFNNWQNVSDAYTSGGLGSPPGGGLSGNLQPGLVLIKNNTDKEIIPPATIPNPIDYPSMSILGINDVLIKPANALANFKTNQQTVLVCGVIDPQKHVNKWVCLRDPIAAGNIGWAYADGIFPVNVLMPGASAWETSTVYNAGEYLTSGGNIYMCIRTHTSGSTTEPETGASWATYWELSYKDTAGTITGNLYDRIKYADFDARLDADNGGIRETNLVAGGGGAEIIHVDTTNILTTRLELCLVRKLDSYNFLAEITESISGSSTMFKSFPQGFLSGYLYRAGLYRVVQIGGYV